MDYISARNREMQATLKVLQAYPEAKVDLKPAEKSRTAGELSMIFAVEERVLKSLLETGATNLDFLRPHIPSTMAEIIVAFQQAVAANDAVLATLTPQQYDKRVNFYTRNISLGDLCGLSCLTIFTTGANCRSMCAWPASSCRPSTGLLQTSRLVPGASDQIGRVYYSSSATSRENHQSGIHVAE
jgi:hypothetical protein